MYTRIRIICYHLYCCGEVVYCQLCGYRFRSVGIIVIQKVCLCKLDELLCWGVSLGYSLTVSNIMYIILKITALNF